MARPKKITERVIQKLEEGFIWGMSDREACIYANVAPSTLYDYCNQHKEFSERKELLKESVKMRAKINVARKINSGVYQHGILNVSVRMNFHSSRK